MANVKGEGRGKGRLHRAIEDRLRKREGGKEKENEREKEEREILNKCYQRLRKEMLLKFRR